MKKILTFLILVALCSSVLAVDTVRVIRSGKLIKTTEPTFLTVTTTQLIASSMTLNMTASAATGTTANYSIPVTVNGKAYKILLIK